MGQGYWRGVIIIQTDVVKSKPDSAQRGCIDINFLFFTLFDTHQHHPEADLPGYKPVLPLAGRLALADPHHHRRKTVGHGATQTRHNLATP